MKIIKYTLYGKTNAGTDEKPVWHECENAVQMPWSEENEEIAKREAYNGEYTIEDDGQPEPDTTTTDDVLNALLGVTV